ncbi:MAG: aldehyde dehydrogenase [Mycobacterium sp.]|nr:aldehyde dehydrogenase [Mycobacterium sp.]
MGEVRMLIDGELVEAGSGKRFANVNPATEEVLGEVADADADDMTRAIAAARRAFDDTDWSTNRQLRKRCLRQLQDALVADQEQLRQELVEEAGTPVMMTYGAQLDWPLAEALTWPMDYIDEFEWERELPVSHQIGLPSRRGVYKEAIGVIGAIVRGTSPSR